MSTDIFRQGGTKNGDSEKARRAIAAFRKLQPTLSAYARALTGKPAIKVVMSSDGGKTDSKSIYYRPPLSLGDDTKHERDLCMKRDDKLRQKCPACAIREQVLITIYHEIGHIAYDSFERTSKQVKADAVERAVREVGSKYSDKVARRLAMAPEYQKDSYIGLAGLISPFLPAIVNAIEDARINASVMRARPGTKVMFEAEATRVFTEGVEQTSPTGELVTLKWIDYPLNMQAAVGLYLKASGYDYTGWLRPEVIEALEDPDVKDALRGMHTLRSVTGVYEMSFPILAAMRRHGFFKSDIDPEVDEEQDDPPPFEDNSQNEEQSDGEEEQEGFDSGENQGGDGQPDSDSDDDTVSEGDGNSGGRDDSEDRGDEEGSGEADSGGSSDSGLGDDSDGPEESPQAGEGGEGSGEDRGEESEGQDGPDRDDDEGEASAGGDGGESDSSDGSDASDADESLGADDGRLGDDHWTGDRDGDDPQDSDGDENSGESEQSSHASGESSTDSPQSSEVVDADSDDASGDSSESERGEAEGLQNSSGPENSSDEPVSRDNVDGDLEPAEGSSDDASDYSVQEASAPTSDMGDRSSGGDDQEPSVPEGEPGEVADDGLGSDQSVSSDDGDPLDSGEDGPGTTVNKISSFDELDMGSPEQARDAVHDIAHPEDNPEIIEEMLTNYLDEDELDRAIAQVGYFETPSSNIFGVKEHYYDTRSDDAIAWTRRKNAWGYSNRELGIEGDFDPEEAILGPALMRMRVAFADNRRSREDRNRKSGKVDGRVLGRRVRFGDDRLFKTRSIPGKKDYFVVIGVDISGSTVGENIVLAKRAAMAQAELLTRMGIKFALYCHTGSWHAKPGDRDTGFDMDIYHVKDAEEPWTDVTRQRLRDIGPAVVNLDGHTIEYYRKLLDRRTETHRIIMYYTDGKMPAENHNEELVILQREIRICKQKGYTLMGVGINTDSPIEHGLDTVMVTGDEDIVKVVKHIERRLLNP